MNVKADFPIFSKHPDLAYLDSAATSQKPQTVIDAVSNFYSQTNANIHRGIYDLSQNATEMFEAARQKTAEFIGSDSAKEIIFTSGATESINLVAQGWARHNLKPGDIVVTSVMEHHSNFVPWLQLKEELGVELVILPTDENYRLDYQNTDIDFSRVKLIALTHASNVLGTINPVREIAEFFRKGGAKAKLLVDAAQSALHVPLNVSELKADFLAFSAHKMLGPTGVGVLYAQKEAMDQMQPMLHGSHMIESVSSRKAVWTSAPDKFEPGTRNIEGVIGLGAAIDYLTHIAPGRTLNRGEREMTEYALAQFACQEDVNIFGPGHTKDRIGVFSFAVEGIHPHDTAEILNRSHVAVRAGHHCAQPLMNTLGVSGTARASIGPYNTKSDIDELFEAIDEVKRVFHVR